MRLVSWCIQGLFDCLNYVIRMPERIMDDVKGKTFPVTDCYTGLGLGRTLGTMEAVENSRGCWKVEGHDQLMSGSLKGARDVKCMQYVGPVLKYENNMEIRNLS